MVKHNFEIHNHIYILILYSNEYNMNSITNSNIIWLLFVLYSYWASIFNIY